MSYLGKVALKASDIRRLDVTSSTSATHTLTWTPPNEQSLIITINGVKQQNNYSISGVTLTLDTALVATDEMEVIGINDIGTTTVPGDGTVTTAKIEDDAVTADKLANSINTEIAANTAKVTNATHTGDVTGATALTIAADAVDIAMLSATGTASSSTFLRGDNAWATPSGGKILQVVVSEYAEQSSYIDSTSWSDTGGMTVAITPASASNNIIVLVNDCVYIGTNGFHQYRIYETVNSATVVEIGCGTSAGGQWLSPINVVGYYNPGDTNALEFKTYMQRMDGSASSRMRDSQIDDSGNVYRMIALEVSA